MYYLLRRSPVRARINHNILRSAAHSRQSEITISGASWHVEI